MLDYNKISDTIKKRNYRLKYFIPKVTGMTEQGFKKSIINKTLKISTLEEITKALDLLMRYWWDKEDIMFYRGDKEYIEKLERRINELNAEVANYDYIIELQKKTIEKLESDLGIPKVGT